MPDVMTEIAVHRRLSQLVAINAGDHGNFLFLPERVPVLHRTVAHRTRHAGIDVLLVTEENEVWKRIHPGPRKQVVVSLDLGQLLDRWATGLDTLMAGHTIRDSGDLHLTVGSGGLMARVAFHSCLNMLLVTERDRLRNRFNGPADVLGFASRTRRNRSRLSLRSHSCRTLSFREQSVSRQDSWGSSVRIEISTRPHRNHHKLLSGFLPQIRHGCGVRVGFELVNPQFLSCPRIERPEAVIGGAANEDQSARS